MAGRVGTATAQLVVDHFKHAFEISINLIIPEAKCTKPCARQRSIAPEITSLMDRFVVLTTIDLNDQPFAHANEIDDKTPAWRLTAKMEAAPAP
jgi:hypothetical protein